MAGTFSRALLYRFIGVFFGLFVGTLWNTNGYGQSSPKVYQISGLILDRTTSAPVPYVRISVNQNQRLGISNTEGFFSIPVVHSDTLVFTHIGYKQSKLAVGAYLAKYRGDTSSNYIYEIHYMQGDTLLLPEVIVYPYRNAVDMKYAILHMNTQERLSIAQVQPHVDPALVSFFMNNLPADNIQRMQVAQQRYEQYYTKSNLYPTATFFDAAAVYNLLKYLGSKKKSK